MASAVPNLKDILPEERETVRNRVMEEMHPNLRAWVEAVEQKLADKAESGLRFYWGLGEEASVVKKETTKYGGQAIEKAAFCLGEDKEVLFKAIRFRNKFDEDDLENLLRIRVQNTGRLLTWSHVVVSMIVEDKEERLELLRQAAACGWNHEEFDRAVAKAINRKSRHAGGRNLLQPKTIDAMLHSMQKSLVPLGRKFSEVWNAETSGFLTIVQATDPLSYSPDMVSEIDVLGQEVAKLEDQAGELKKQLDNAKQRIERSLAQKAKEAAEKSAEKITGAKSANKTQKAKVRNA